MKYIHDSLTRHYGDQIAPNYINAKACEIGEELMSGLRRNFISIQDVEKKCS
jgi:hypothetical protein